jgi:hypothetical protein
MSRLLKGNVYLGGIGKNMSSTTHVLVFTQLSCSFMLTWAVTSKKVDRSKSAFVTCPNGAGENSKKNNLAESGFDPPSSGL